MFHKYFWLFPLAILVLAIIVLFVCFQKQKENFDQPKWEKTLRCLQFNQNDIHTFKEDILNGKDPNYLISKTIRTARKKGLDDNQVFKCLTTIN